MRHAGSPSYACVPPQLTAVAVRRPCQPQHLLDQPDAAQGAHLACALPASCARTGALPERRAPGRREARPGLSAGAARRQDYEPPSGELLDAIERDFGSLDDMVSKFNPKTAAVQAAPRGPPADRPSKHHAACVLVSGCTYERARGPGAASCA